jgi:hypothetical protein
MTRNKAEKLSLFRYIDIMSINNPYFADVIPLLDTKEPTETASLPYFLSFNSNLTTPFSFCFVLDKSKSMLLKTINL